MKKLLFGSVTLLVFTLAITVIEVSCQKSVAQVSTTQPSEHLLLYHTTNQFPVTYQVSSDTAGIKQTRTDIHAINTYYVSKLDGSNERMIPVNIPQGMYSGDYAKLTDDGTMLLFSLYEVKVPPPPANGNPIYKYYIYSCMLDGTNLKKVKEGFALDDVH